MESGFGKRLASSDKKVRDQATAQLLDYLHANAPSTSDLNLLKLWKGLFYCFWMSDKVKVQHMLAHTLASPIATLPHPHNIRYLRAFWTTVIREWAGIDRLRLDKFYYLLRRVHATTCATVLAINGGEGVDEWKGMILTDGPMGPGMKKKVPDSLRYHFVDVFVDELVNGVTDAESSDQINVPLELLEPLLSVLATTDNSLLLTKLQSALLSFMTLPSEQLKIDTTALARRIFAIAADRATLHRNRQVCYKMFEEMRESVEKDGGEVDVSDLVVVVATNSESKGRDAEEDDGDVNEVLESPMPIISAKKSKRASLNGVKSVVAAGASKKPNGSSKSAKRSRDDGSDSEEEPKAPVKVAQGVKSKKQKDGAKRIKADSGETASDNIAVADPVMATERTDEGSPRTERRVRFGANQVKTFIKRSPILESVSAPAARIKKGLPLKKKLGISGNVVVKKLNLNGSSTADVSVGKKNKVRAATTR